MKQCDYIYCGSLLSSEADHCPICGKATAKFHPEPHFIDLGLKRIVDMHQILPRQEGALDLQLKWMQALKIEQVLLQSVPDKVSSISNNEMLRTVKASHPDRFHISQFMDPRHPIARKKITTYAQNGARVIKLLPCLGYQPDHKKYDKFWRRMEELNLAAMVHTGFITARHKAEEHKHQTFLNSNFGNPLYFDVVARKFPKLQIILCHTGGAIWYEQACQMINQHDNVWGDLSGFGHFALDRILQLKIPLKWEKLFWGNDSHPEYYGVNLRLTANKLTAAGRADLIPGVFQQNGERFIQQFLT